jgi:hypothetical protein
VNRDPRRAHLVYVEVIRYDTLTQTVPALPVPDGSTWVLQLLGNTDPAPDPPGTPGNPSPLETRISGRYRAGRCSHSPNGSRWRAALDDAKPRAGLDPPDYSATAA